MDGSARRTQRIPLNRFSVAREAVWRRHRQKLARRTGRCRITNHHPGTEDRTSPAAILPVLFDGIEQLPGPRYLHIGTLRHGISRLVSGPTRGLGAPYRETYPHLGSCLQVSELGDAVVLLKPSVEANEGEWQAYFFANWIPGARVYKSFGAFMRNELEQFCEWRNR